MARKSARQTGRDREWNGAERLEAIAPVLGAAMQIPELRATAGYAPAFAARLSAATQAEIQKAVSAAARASGASEPQIRTWLDAFIALGKPGLMNEIALTAADCAANLNGTWELASRFSGGVETPARGQLYNDMNPERARGRQMITMWTDVNHFKRGGAPVLLIGLANVEYKQNGPYEVIGTSRGTIIGNFGDYERGVKTQDTFRLVRRGQNETMLGVPSRSESGPGSDSAARFLVEVGGDPGTIKFKMWGVPATADRPRTMDTVDTYVIMSNRRPLIGGWETITEYFERMTKPAERLREVQRMGKRGDRLHLVQAGSRASLVRACEDVEIPRGSRLS